MTEQSVKTETEVTASVLRCGCTPEEKEAPDFHGTLGLPCPHPRAIEDQGVIARLKE